MATIADGTNTITIPDALEWTDELNWSPVTQNNRRTIGGAFISEEATLTFGRPITLEGGEQVWMNRGVYKQLQTLSNRPGQKYVLTLADGRTFNVIFRRDQGNALNAEPLWRLNVQPDSQNVRNVTLRFYEVDE